MRCPDCSTRMTQQSYEHVTRIGGYTVTDSTGTVETCPKCGEVSLSSDELAAYERRAARQILTVPKCVNGVVLKYARKALGLRQRDLAQILRRNEQQISRDENSEDLPMDLRLAVAELLERAERGEPLDLVGTSTESTLRIREAS